MTRSRLSSGVLVSAVVAGAFVAVPAVAAGAAGAAVSAAAPIDCPTAFPIAEAVDGVVGTGYTVERGTTPAPFTATILGRVTDGIAPGIDMIMADLDSPALTRAGGVWAGMSGSPVYAADGRLIGSVSYGLSASSPIAGITPAADLQQLLLLPPSPALAPASAKARIKVSGALAVKLANAGGVSAAQADEGFRQLPVPVSVSGAAKKSAKFLKRLTATAGVRVRLSGAGTSAAASSPSEITAGSNFAAALSYGDVSIVGVGTTTFVCNGQAVAFGHPMINAGDVQFTAHPASAVYIQPDPVNGPFKVANPGGPVGVIDQDRTTGIRAELGAVPASSFAVTSTLRADGAAAVTGSTTGVYQPWTANIAALHLQSNIVKALGAEGAGSAALTFTITGTRAGGKPFTLVRADHYSDSADLSFTAADSLNTLVTSLVEQPFEPLTITGVQITGSVSSTVKQYRVTGLKVKKRGQWVTLTGSQTVTAGRTMPMRITLTKYRSPATVVVPLTVKIPTRTEGASGDLILSDGLNAGFNSGGDSGMDDSAADGPPVGPTSLTQLLAQLTSAPTNDCVAGSLLLGNGRRSVTTVTLGKTDAIVSEYLKDIPLQVRF
jgi:hypothetical protein